MGKETTFAKENPNRAWKKWQIVRHAAKKISRASSPSIDERADSLHLNMQYNNYLQETAQGIKEVQNKIFKIHTFSEEEKQNAKLVYDKDLGKFFKANDMDKTNKEPISTTGVTSKSIANVMAFVMSKEGDLYITKHGPSDTNEIVVHGSILDRVPVEMAGLLSIQDGKITKITDNSGHYMPEPLDMYRGIQKLLKANPEAFSTQPEATVEIHDKTVEKLSVFLKNIESQYEALRNARMESFMLDDIKRGISIAKSYMLPELHRKILSSEPLSAIDLTPNSILEKDRFGHTAIYYAIQKKDVALTLAKSLYSNGASIESKQINHPDAEGKTLLHHAVHEDPNLVLWCYENGANVNAKSNSGSTPLHQAVEAKKANIISALIGKKANIDAQDSDGMTPLHYAVAAEQVDIISLLCEKKANINVQDISGMTPLHLATQCEQVDAIAALIKNGADVNLVNYEKFSPLHYAIDTKNQKIVDLFIENGAKVNYKDLILGFDNNIKLPSPIITTSITTKKSKSSFVAKITALKKRIISR